MAALIDGNSKFLIDECLSPELTEIAKTDYGAAMDFIAGLADAVNKLIEVDSNLNVSVADWPSAENPDAWNDPFKPK